jgi:leader peptidase (prepilin peptidase) / N-methyltransferase
VNWWVILASGAVGLAVGPFLRRLVDQVPGRDPLFDRPVRELVPLLSWFAAEPGGTLILRGSPDDRQDAEAIETARLRWRAPVIDLGAGLVLGLLGGRIGWVLPLPAFLVFGAALVVVTVIDVDHFRIPDRIVFPSLALCLPLLLVAATVDDVTDGFLAAAAGAAAYFIFLFVFFMVSPRGMGFGDVKLALLLGLHVGWAGAVVLVDGEPLYRGLTYGMQLVLMAALFGSLLGSIVGLTAVAVKRRRKVFFPFGPALCLGALLAVLFSEQVLNYPL